MSLGATHLNLGVPRRLSSPLRLEMVASCSVPIKANSNTQGGPRQTSSGLQGGKDPEAQGALRRKGLTKKEQGEGEGEEGPPACGGVDEEGHPRLPHLGECQAPGSSVQEVLPARGHRGFLSGALPRVYSPPGPTCAQVFLE